MLTSTQINTDRQPHHSLRCSFLLATLLLCLKPTVSFSISDKDYASLFDLSLQELMNIEITTASKHSEPIADAPAFVYVISHQDIKMRGYAILSDVLRDLPGFDTTEYGRAEFGTEISVRGIAGNNKTILLVDGVRVNSPGAEPLQVRGDISVRHAQRIEFVYGPGSTLYGQDAINAVINIITKNGEDQNASQVLLVGGERNYKEAYVGYNNTFTIDNNVPLLLSGYIQVLDADLAELDSEYPAWWDELYSGSIAQAEGADPAVRWDEGLNINLNLESPVNTLRLWYRKSSRSTADGSTNPGLYSELSYWEDEELMLNFHHLDVISAHINLHTSLTYKRIEVDPESRFAILRTDGQSFFTNRKYAISSGVTWEERLEVQIDDHLFINSGLVWENHSTLPKTTINEGAFDTNGNVVLQAGVYSYYTVAGDASSLVVEARATELHYQKYGAFLEFNYQQNEKTALVLGMRQDHDEQSDESPLSIRFAAIHNINDQLTAKYIYSEAFSSAAPYFAYVNFGTADSIVTNNTGLEAEQAKSHEVNINWQGQNGFGGMSLYYNTQENLIQEAREGYSFNLVNAEVYRDEAGTILRKLIHTANGGSSIAQGVDLYGRYQVQDNASAWASYSYVDYEAKIEGTHRGLQNISSNNVRLGLTYNVRPNWWLTPSLVYRSTPQNFQALRELNDEVRDPYWINLMVRYTPLTHVEAFLRIDNLTDNKIALKGSGGPLPQEPRSIRVGLSYQY